jgi:tryptophan 2,3-dioxygenase
MGPEEITYTSYLRLDDLLACQDTPSGHHDELLFVVIHQVYELWFKQILHEASLLQRRLEAGQLSALAVARRIAKILKTAVGQLDVLETMTPAQFAAFRPGLAGASGFQSLQFRRIEATLGRRDFAAFAYRADPELARVVRSRSLWDSLLRFLSQGGHEMPIEVLERDPCLAWEAHPAVTAVLAHLYTEDKGGELDVCESLVDIDEGLQEWRYRHVKAVERILGPLPGTGGSTGASYLRTTLFSPSFPDLWAARAAGYGPPEINSAHAATAETPRTAAEPA